MTATVSGTLNILEDRLNTKETIFEDYKKSFYGKNVPIVIDNGKYCMFTFKYDKGVIIAELDGVWMKLLDVRIFFLFFLKRSKFSKPNIKTQS